MKLVLIEPRAPGKHIYSKMKLPRLGPVLLGTIARDLGWDVRIYVEEIEEIDYQDALTADLVGISSITSTARRAYAMADALREYGATVVMGGPHVTFLPEEALEHCDYVVRGEAEEAFPRLLDTIVGKEALADVPSLSYHDEDGSIRHNQQAGFIEDLDKLPHPDFNLIAGWRRAKAFGIAPVLPILATRGCPFGCKFCSVIEMFGRRMRHRSIEHIADELEQYRGQKNHIFFYDDNFTADRERAKELIRRTMIEQKLVTKWSAQVRIDAARDRELLGLMRRAKCSNVYVGFESANPTALREMHKGQSVEDMTEAVARFREYDIDVHGMFVLGFDSDTRDSIRETIRFAMRSGILSVQFLLLTPIPGTPLFNEIRDAGRLSCSDWSHFDGHHVVYQHPNMSAWELQLSQIVGHTRFYSRWRALTQMAKGYISASVIYIYARRLQEDWLRNNRVYIKALKLADRAGSLKLKIDFSFDLSDIKMQVQTAAAKIPWIRARTTN